MKILGKEISGDTLVKHSMLFNHFLVGANIIFIILFTALHIYLIIPFIIFDLGLSIFNYSLIKKNKLYHWTRSLYFLSIKMMAVGSVFFGFGYGFNLYSISTISLSFYIYYLGKHNNYKRRNPMLVPLITMGLYFICYFIVNITGPLYTVNDTMQMIFFVNNSTLVFSILIIYMFIFLGKIEQTEKKLEEMAHVDNLTGLYNRHYMLSYINDLLGDKLTKSRIAILDIDNFKGINDHYGHNCGDLVLKSIARNLEDLSERCTVCRWGGEEFIILSSAEDKGLLEELRQKIADTKIEYEGQTVSVTVTIGTENYSPEYSVDKWISEADKKLYEGKNSGKNKVVS